MCVIDEVGKMELFSQPFAQAVRQTLSAPGTVVLGTIPVPKGKPLALVEEIRSRADVRVFSVSAAALGAAGRGGHGSGRLSGAPGALGGLLHCPSIARPPEGVSPLSLQPAPQLRCAVPGASAAAPGGADGGRRLRSLYSTTQLGI